MKIWRLIKSNIYIKTVLAAILIFVLLVFITLWWLSIYTRHNEAVLVPDVKGLTMDEATPFFVNKKLRYTVVDSVYKKEVSPGGIIETIPKAGTKVKEDRIIFITINAVSAKKVAIPDVTDQSQRQALAMLKALGFTNVTVEYVPAAYKDLVLGLKYKGNDAVPGERVPINSRLVLQVSSGSAEPEPVEMENTDGQGAVEPWM